jgi:hypothetical protein
VRLSDHELRGSKEGRDSVEWKSNQRFWQLIRQYSKHVFDATKWYLKMSIHIGKAAILSLLIFLR